MDKTRMNQGLPPAAFVPQQLAKGLGAPPVYRPTPPRNHAAVAQRRSAVGPLMGQAAVVVPVRPVAPPVYRPAPSMPTRVGMPAVAAPPVYRAARPVQPKMMQSRLFQPPIAPSGAPPVYRPLAVMQRMETDPGGGGRKDFEEHKRSGDEKKQDASSNKRARRLSTRLQTEETNTRMLAGPEPVDRPRRGSTTYRNVDLNALHGVAPDQELRAAIRAKKIWSGDRGDVSWSTGFADQFWRDSDTGAGWVCAHGFAGCGQPVAATTHAGLEIGHKKGFYNQVVDTVDPVIVCDGNKHWEVMLHADVVGANQKEANLEPQCVSCNRDPRQKAKDDQGKGKYKPEYKGPCPGPDCGTMKISDL